MVRFSCFYGWQSHTQAQTFVLHRYCRFCRCLVGWFRKAGIAGFEVRFSCSSSVGHTKLQTATIAKLMVRFSWFYGWQSHTQAQTFKLYRYCRYCRCLVGWFRKAGIADFEVRFSCCLSVGHTKLQTATIAKLMVRFSCFYGWQSHTQA